MSRSRFPKTKTGREIADAIVARALENAKKQAAKAGATILVRVGSMEVTVFPDGATVPRETSACETNAVSDVERGQLDGLLDAAYQHGEQSERDHEAGDLVEILRSCWNLLEPAQRALVFAEHKHLLEDWRTE
jgi:hypothetical protein